MFQGKGSPFWLPHLSAAINPSGRRSFCRWKGFQLAICVLAYQRYYTMDSCKIISVQSAVTSSMEVPNYYCRNFLPMSLLETTSLEAGGADVSRGGISLSSFVCCDKPIWLEEAFAGRRVSNSPLASSLISDSIPWTSAK